MTVPVTALYTGLCLILLLVLAIKVVGWRRKAQVSLGDGDHKDLRQAIRSHGNAAEHMPLVLLGLAILELNGTSGWLLHLYGSVFFVARIMHAVGLGRPRAVNAPRQLGVLITWIIMLAMGIQLIISTLPMMG